jgi:uncharacterized protein (TIGR00661 family)
MRLSIIIFAGKMRILITVLNWGLGHATRCIPVIKMLQQKGVEPVIASDGEALAFLSEQFPELPVACLPSYKVRYSSKSMVWNMMVSMPHIFGAIAEEKKVIKNLIREYQINAIISDNRYGCYSSEVYSALIIHQINIRTPAYLSFLEPLLFYIHRYFLNHFHAILVPDYEGLPNLSGELSHKRKLKHVQFIGPLSHLSSENKNTVSSEFDLLVICSGPEPSRTRFEQLMLREVSAANYKTAFVRGTYRPLNRQLPENIRCFDMCSSDEIKKLMHASKLVISRSGYSTIMDLVYAGKNAILIPTPGQTEQEYLAAYHHRQKNFYCVSEKNFSLSTALSKSKGFKNNFKLSGPDNLYEAMDKLLRSIESKKNS